MAVSVFSHKLEAVTIRRIWTILPRLAAEFRELARGIWPNFLRKTVVPTDALLVHCFLQWISVCLMASKR